MKKTFVLGIYGNSNTGKTNLMIDLIKHYKEKGFKVATLKITDKNIAFDKPGKDTFKHGEAGSDLVTFSSSIETVFLIKEKQTINNIISNISNFDYYDIIFVEGANDKKTPKIRIGDITERENTICTYYGDFLRLINIITEKMNERVDKNE